MWNVKYFQNSLGKLEGCNILAIFPDWNNIAFTIFMLMFQGLNSVMEWRIKNLC